MPPRKLTSRFRRHEEFYVSMTPRAMLHLVEIIEKSRLEAPSHAVHEVENLKNDLFSRLQRISRGE